MLKLVYFCFYSNGCCMEHVDLFSVWVTLCSSGWQLRRWFNTSWNANSWKRTPRRSENQLPSDLPLGHSTAFLCFFFCHPKWGWAYWHCTDFWSVWCLLAETDQDQKGARGNFLRFFLLNVGIAPHQSKPPSLHNWLYILHRWHLSTFQNPCLMNCLALGLGQVIISFICIVKTLSCVRMRKVYEVNMWETVSFFRSARKVWNDRTWWHN